MSYQKLLIYSSMLLSLLYLTYQGYLQHIMIHYALFVYLITKTFNATKSENLDEKNNVMKYWITYSCSIFFDNIIGYILENYISIMFVPYLFLKLGLIMWVLKSDENFKVFYMIFDEIYTKSGGDLNVLSSRLEELNKNYLSMIQDTFESVQNYSGSAIVYFSSLVKMKKE